ncbi:MAG: sugar-binding domain-containing protein [Rikenellaceae bacterium]
MQVAQQSEKIVYEIGNPGWMFEGTLPGRGVELRFHEILPDCNYAKVPGDVFTDLWRLGRIEDMNVGQNPMKAKWVNEYEWWYFNQFNLPKEMEGKELTLRFDGVDYECEVYLNGKLLGSHAGMFDHFTFDISDLVNYTTKDEMRELNYLAIRLLPAVRTLGLANGLKYRWHGDYNQNIVPTGIWQPVKIIATGEQRITDLYLRSDLAQNGATVDVQIEIDNKGAAGSVSAEICLTGENFKSKNYTATINTKLKKGLNTIKETISVEDAKLWWPWDLGDQNLYTAKVVLKSAGGVVQDVEESSFGIREVKMEMNPGWEEGEVGRPWTVMINGKRHFVRSGTWGGPPDMFTGRTTEQTYRELIRLAREANINNLRIFNWHPVEIPLFYKLCNEAGITVWQDMGMINNNVVQEEQIKQAAFKGIIGALKDRRNHPCNIIIEGSEEILFVSKASVRDYNWKLVNELGDVLKDYTDLHYVPTSPLSDHNGIKLGEARHDTAHPHFVHYSMGKLFMEDYYPTQNYAAIPELAVTSCPDVESIRKFIPEDELWPPKPSWGYRWADLDVLQGHNYEVFGEDFTNRSLEEFVEATQIAQGVYFQYSMELYRTRKPKMSAICFCHFILNTPDFKWATVDYYLRPKESHYYIQRAYQPLLVTMQYAKRRWMPNTNFEGKLWVVNDFMKSYDNCRAELRILDDKKQLVEKQLYTIGNIEEDSSKEFVDVSFPVPGKMGDKFYLELTLKDDNGAQISANEYMFLVDDQEKALEVYKKYGEGSTARKAEYGSATNRYFPGLFDNTKGLSVEWLDVK